MNEVTLIGRFVREVELTTTSNGTRVLNNVLAIHRYHRQADGEEITDFIPVVFWNHLAEIVSKHHQKGDLIAVSGRMQSRNYENKHQQKVYVVECHVSEMTLLPNHRYASQAMRTDADKEETQSLSPEEKALTDEIIEQMKV